MKYGLNKVTTSTEEISEIFVFFSRSWWRSLLLLGFFLLLLLFFGFFLLGSSSSGTCTGSDFLLSVSDQLVKGFSLETFDASIDIVVRDLRSDVAE